MGLSIRAYAAHRGVSHTSVRKAIASGRLTTGPDGTIDPVKADRAWVRNADPSKARDSHKLKAVPEHFLALQKKECRHQILAVCLRLYRIWVAC